MNPVVIKPSSWLTQGIRTEQVNHLTLFKFTEELGDHLQELLDKKKADTLTPQEAAELEAIGELDTIFSYINAVITSQPQTTKDQLSLEALECSDTEIKESYYRLKHFEEDWNAPGMDAYNDL